MKADWNGYSAELDKLIEDVERRSWMDELTPICQMKDLPLDGSTTCRWSRGFVTLTTSQSGLLDQRSHSWSP